MTELHVEANGLRFRCLSAGPPAAPLVLLLHGFPEGAESWAPQLEALAGAGCYAVAPDLRGYGGTDCPEGEEAYRMPHLIADVEGLIGALGRERCHLVGHDWGALVGWSVVSYRPGRVISWSALSVGHPDAFADTIRDDPDQRQRSSYIVLFRRRGKAEEVLLEDGCRRLRGMYRIGPAPDAVPAAAIDHFVEGLTRPGRLTAALAYYRANMGEKARQAFPPAPLPITPPSQLIWGDEDPALGRGPTERTASYTSGEYRLETLAGAGHWLQFERPADVSRLVVEWIDAHPDGAI